ncbi:MAG TPA: hypothetical protein PK733_08090 [Clostridiales bacterium]|nr:hypothetical protein [Clostridiales bacterium]
MEDKTFELMTKLYSEVTSQMETMNTRLADMDTKLADMDTRLSDMDTRLSDMDRKLDTKADKHDIIRLENKMHNDISALYDGYKQTYEKIEILEKKVDGISDKVEKQEVEIKVIKGGKQAKAKYHPDDANNF